MMKLPGWCSDLKHKAFPPKQPKVSWKGRDTIPVAYAVSGRSFSRSRSTEDKVAAVAASTMGIALGIVGAVVGVAVLYALIAFSFVAVVLTASTLFLLAITGVALGSI